MNWSFRAQAKLAFSARRNAIRLSCAMIHLMRLTVTIAEDVLVDATIAAARSGVSLSDLIELALRQTLRRSGEADPVLDGLTRWPHTPRTSTLPRHGDGDHLGQAKQ